MLQGKCTLALLVLATQLASLATARNFPLQDGRTAEQPFIIDHIVHDPDVVGSAATSPPPSTSASNTNTRLTQYVNIFVGTEANNDPGDVFAGASVPYGMAKATINVEGYAPAGYVWPSDQPTRGVSPLHDSGTGSSDGSYGNFCIMPVLCADNSIDACPTLLDPRKRLRRPTFLSSL